MTLTSTDVIIIGAGLAGATTATLLARQGTRVTVVDRWSTFPPCFKAEKIEPDQAELFRKFGLMETLLPWTGSIREILRAQHGRVISKLHIEQYGIFYHDMVNAIRATIPPTVEFRIGGVQDIATGSEVQHVTLTGGEVLTSRLVVLACGTGGDLQTRLGLHKQVIQREQSLALGFTLARRDGQPFGFEAVTYYPTGTSRIAYLTLFLIGAAMRANMFVFWSNSEEQTRRFVREPSREIARLLPGLTSVIGGFEVIDRVETSRIDLYRTEGPAKSGLVLLADAFQSACPTTGSGLSKVLTDVDVLCSECVPEWLSTPGMGAEKIVKFYRNPRKQDVDRRSLQNALYARRLTMDDSLPWRLRRLKWDWENRLDGWWNYLRLTRKATV